MGADQQDREGTWHEHRVTRSPPRSSASPCWSRAAPSARRSDRRWRCAGRTCRSSRRRPQRRRVPPRRSPSRRSSGPRSRSPNAPRTTLSTLSTPLPTDRSLRVECSELTVPADPDQPGLGAASLGVVRVGLASSPLDNRPPLLALGDSTAVPTARNAVRLAGAGGARSPAAVHADRAGPPRRGRGYPRLRARRRPRRSRRRRSRRSRRVRARLAAGAGPRGRAGVQPRARRWAQRLSHISLGVRTSNSSASPRRRPAVRRSVWATGHAALAGWARTAPTAVGRLVLDGHHDPTLDEPDLSESRAGAAEAAFGAFAVACTAPHRTARWAPTRAPPSQRSLQQLRTQPLADADGRRLTAGATVTALLAGLAEPRGWPDLGRGAGRGEHR